MHTGSRAVRRALLVITAVGVLLTSLLFVGDVESVGLPSRRAAASSASEMLATVNALRIANGLPPYSSHPILMSIAQSHAEYMASTGSVTHYGADGSRPYQRALAAGYPLAGDLSRGGFMSENIISGTGMSAQQAVTAWLGDAPHTNTMLSTYAQDAGVGVAIVGDRVYYVLDAALATGSTPRYTPGPDGTFPTAVYYAPLVSTIFPSTPLASGVVRHEVKAGETLWLIAITYGTKVDSIRALNSLAPDAPLHPGLDLLIFPEGTVTPPPPNRAGPTMLSLLATATAPGGVAGSTAGSGVAGSSAVPQSGATTPPTTPNAVGGQPEGGPIGATGASQLGEEGAMTRSSGLGLVALIIGGSLLVAALLAFRRRGSD